MSNLTMKEIHHPCSAVVTIQGPVVRPCAGSVLAIAHGRSMARVTAPAVLGESALLAAIAGVPAKRPLTYRCGDL